MNNTVVKSGQAHHGVVLPVAGRVKDLRERIRRVREGVAVLVAGSIQFFADPPPPVCCMDLCVSDVAGLNAGNANRITFIGCFVFNEIGETPFEQHDLFALIQKIFVGWAREVVLIEVLLAKIVNCFGQARAAQVQSERRTGGQRIVEQMHWEVAADAAISEPDFLEVGDPSGFEVAFAAVIFGPQWQH